MDQIKLVFSVFLVERKSELVGHYS